VVVVAATAIAILVLYWGLSRVSAPRAGPHQSGGTGSAGPDSPGTPSEAEPVMEETRADAALAVSRGGHLALLEILGEAGEPYLAISAVSISPDGTTLASAGKYGPLRVWDVSSGTARLLRTIDAHVVTLAWSPDGARVASAGFGDIVAWDPWTGRETLRIERRLRTSRFDLAFSPDGSRLYTTAAVTGVDVWDLASGEEVTTLWGERPPLQDGAIGEGLRAEKVAVGPDGSWLAAAIYEDPLQIIDTRSGHLIRRLTGLDDPATYVTVSNGSLLAISKGTLHVWNTGTWGKVASIRGPSGQVAATQDGASVICTIPEASTLTIWSLQNGTLIDEIHVGSKPLALAARDRAIWVGCEDGTVKRYEHRP